MKKLKDQIIVLQGIPSESEETKLSKLNMTQTAIKTFIKGCLNMGIDAQTIQMALENLHTKDTDIVIDSDLFHWCLAELEKQNKICNPESSFIRQESAQPLHEVRFDKEVLQNSLLACHLLDHPLSSGEDMAYPNSLHELNHSVLLQIEARDNEGSHSTDELLESCSTSSLESTATNSQSIAFTSSNGSSRTEPPDVAVHRYLIAKGVKKPNGHVVYYLAFGSHQRLKEWSESHISFENGNEQN